MEKNASEVRQRLSEKFSERELRLWAAMEAMRLGYGGISHVCRKTGISRVTITRGIKELKEETFFPARKSRLPGGGRKKGSEQQPTLKPALDALTEPTANGEPLSPLRWTTKSSQHLAETLQQQGFKVSKSLICNLLHEEGYQLAANRTPIERGTNDHNTQFEFINAQAIKFMKCGLPVISVDIRKRGLLRDYEWNANIRCSKQKPKLLMDDDSINKKRGKTNPHRVRHVMRNANWVNLDIDRDIAEFVVESIRRWHKHLGKKLYPNAKEVYLIAEGGWSHNSRLWKYCLQELADKKGLTIHVSHFPSGTSKWEKIEHLFFNHLQDSHTSMNGKKQSLYLDTIISLIGGMTTETGLKVYAMEDGGKYPTGRTISDEEMNTLNIEPNDTLGKWNYTIKPRRKQRHAKKRAR